MHALRLQTSITLATTQCACPRAQSPRATFKQWLLVCPVLLILSLHAGKQYGDVLKEAGPGSFMEGCTVRETVLFAHCFLWAWAAQSI